MFILVGDDSKSSSQGGGKQSPASSVPNDLPEITEEIIHERINNTRIKQAPRR